MDARQHRVFAAAVAGILAALGSVGLSRQAQAQDDAHEEGETAHCYGINKCKGTGDCGGVGHSCAGQNACAGQGYIELNEDDCLRIQGGSLTAAQDAKGDS